MKWAPIQDEDILEKMLGYRVSFRAISRGGEEVREPFSHFTVRKENYESVIRKLESYTRYEIMVSWFTRKAVGPATVTFGGKAA